MIFRQHQLACLSLFSYLIGDEATGRAVVVDPQRDVAGYLADAGELGLTIERVIETHFHADFLSGHLELASATGAAVSYGEGAVTDFPVDHLADGQRIELGDVVLEVRATPGHTPESISIVVWEHATDAVPWGVLTGDTLFIGDVGRPDLLAAGGLSADAMARQLHHSLHHQLLTLADTVRVYPAHGAGSSCGKALSDAVESTIGEQRRSNYALQPMSEDAFVEVVTQGQTIAPLYFAFAADANRRERELLDDHDPPPAIGLDGLLRTIAEGGVTIDCRAPDVFASGHVRGSINVGLDGRFAEYVGDVARAGQAIALVVDAGRATEAKVRLARIGFDSLVGAATDVAQILLEHPDVAERASRLTATDVAEWLAQNPGLQIVDVRNPGEQESGMLPGARSIPVACLLDGLSSLDPRSPTVVYCAGGYRSSIAASLLRAHGFDQVADMQGGFEAWRS